MNRRQAIIAAMSGGLGVMSGAAKTEPAMAPKTNNSSNILQNRPQTVTMSLDHFEKFVFTRGDKSVTISGKEIFEALSEK